MNSIFARLKALMEQTGADCSEGTLNAAELHGYAAGIGYVRNAVFAMLQDVLLQSEAGARRYATLLHLDSSRYTAQELEAAVTARLALCFAETTVTQWQAAFEAVGSGSYTIVADPVSGTPILTFADVAEGDLGELGKFIEQYAAPCGAVAYDGSGMTFADWDAWGKRFFALDNLALPCRILESLRSDMIE